MKKLQQESTIKTKANAAIFISDKVGFRSTNIARNEQGYSMIKKGKFHQEDKKILKVYTYNRSAKYISKI